MGINFLPPETLHDIFAFSVVCQQLCEYFSCHALSITLNHYIRRPPQKRLVEVFDVWFD
ncbi:uncharacterized protein FOMMEDRAFT_153854 [Fomitiporia mediterranea MF3/22]|uniref:uncharacterized protein n=1 Tax=Fomitiporia mediterranea (strain MF3/22) TaxID=694068 RepID=UPI0004407BF8|nr:uncharacterized protein FOMMEDRAFT_153854 [Fomitiporia mediterranea MF3/22]EJD04764.1 hypothetical protein FOMMEDRAFT_153854 [Fomitiporia mediterranea MF3/22]